MSCGGITLAITTGHIQQTSVVWALVTLGVAGQCCDVLLAWAGTRASAKT